MVDDTYLLVNCVGFGESTTLYYSPDVYTILEDTGCNDIYTYNGKAHSHLSSEGELLMSYNVNSPSYKTSMEFLHPQFLKLFTLAPTNKILLGDLNADGDISVSDIVKLRGFILGESTTDVQFAAGDINGDGSLTVTDIVALRGLITKN